MGEFEQTTRRYTQKDRSPLKLMFIFFSCLLFSLRCVCLPMGGLFCVVRLVYHTDMELSPEYIYSVAQKSVNLKHSPVLEGIFRFRRTSQSVKRY
jgi:hypothetical protein